MNTIIELILSHYNYTQETEFNWPTLKFYKHSNPKIASYFLIKEIDCCASENDELELKKKLDLLEYEYSMPSQHSETPIKSTIQKLLKTNQEASQIDKNTSAIYLTKFSDISKLKAHRNAIYAIEESPNYFKRYIIPYTEQQVEQLKIIIEDFKGKNIVNILSDLAYNEEEYYKLLELKNAGSLYELVIRLFAKIPFLQYDFKAEAPPISIEEDIQISLDQKLKNYHLLISENNFSIDNAIGLEYDTTISNDQVERKLNKLISGGKL